MDNMPAASHDAPDTEADYRTRIYGAYVSSPAGVADAARGNTPYLDRLIRLHLPANRELVIIDLGCGSGALIRRLAAHGYKNIRGVDVSLEQVAEAHKLGTSSVAQGDILAYLASIPHSSTDVVVAFDVIEHLTKNELVALVDAVRRVLRPGGRWVIHAPNANSPFGMRIRYGDMTHELAFTAGSLRQLLIASGFAAVDVYEDRPVVHGVISAARWALWQMIRLGLITAIAAETGNFDPQGVLSQNLLAVAYVGG